MSNPTAAEPVDVSTRIPGAMQRDYILRMIEQAADILRHVLQRVLRRAAPPADLDQEMRHAAQLGGLDLELLRLCDGDTALQLVAPTGEPDPARAWLAAELLFVNGMGARLEGRDADAVASFTKARLLYGIVQPDAVLPTGFPEAADRIRDIEDQLDQLNGAGAGSR